METSGRGIPRLTNYRGEFQAVIDIIRASPEFKDAIAKLKIPDYMEIVIEPWPYGYAETAEDTGRLFQGLIFGRDKRQKDDPDSNFYAFPIPIIPVLDIAERRVTRILEMPTGGKGEELRPATDMLKNDSATNAARENPIAGLKPAEYIPDLLPNGTRKSLKTLNVVQPDGPSFTVTDDSLVEWQNWRFRVGFTPREGAIIYDVRFDGRSLFHRLSVSEMVRSSPYFKCTPQENIWTDNVFVQTVPYADPRDPFHRKQAFDFGEGGAGGFANNLSLGCDCLGVIKVSDPALLDMISIVLCIGFGLRMYSTLMGLQSIHREMFNDSRMSFVYMNKTTASDGSTPIGSPNVQL